MKMEELIQKSPVLQRHNKVLPNRVSQVDLAVKLSFSETMMNQSTIAAHNVYFTNFIKMTEDTPLGKSISISRSGSYGTSGKFVRASVSEFCRFDSTITPVNKNK